MATKDDLQDAFAGESQANRKYLAFAKQAEADGYPEVAKRFRAAAAAETAHALAHLRVMGGIGNTETNLETAIEGETYEFREMYPAFLQNAETEGHNPAAFSFRNALAVEEIHCRLYAEALEAVKAGRDVEATVIHVCSICGNTVIGEAPETCPVCGVGKKKFLKIR